MDNKIRVSVILPIYNKEKTIKTTLNSLFNQDIKKKFEIIIINDGSRDNSVQIVKNIKDPRIRFFNLNKNYGPSIARNLGIKKAKGEYFFFLDADDKIRKNTLSVLLKEAYIKNYDLVFCDHKWIQNGINLNKNLFSFNNSKEIYKNDLLEILKKRLYNSLHFGGPLRCKAKLIKSSIIKKKKLLFEKKLRYLEDEIFMWDILPEVKKIKYLKKQLYSYYVNTNTNTAVSEGIGNRFNIKSFFLIKKHIKKSFLKFNNDYKIAENLSDQGFVYFIINVLISYCKSIIQKKVKKKIGMKNLKKLIKNIISYKNLFIVLKKYEVCKNESKVIPEYLMLKKSKMLQLACFARAKQIIDLRNKKYSPYSKNFSINA